MISDFNQTINVSWSREKEKKCTNLLAHSRESVKEANCVHNKLIEVGDDSPLLYSRNLRQQKAEMKDSTHGWKEICKYKCLKNYDNKQT